MIPKSNRSKIEQQSADKLVLNKTNHNGDQEYDLLWHAVMLVLPLLRMLSLS